MTLSCIANAQALRYTHNMIPWMTRFGIIIVCVIAYLYLSGCSMLEDSPEEEVTEETEEPLEIQSAETLYRAAQDAFALRDYVGAVEQFEEVERQHPYSKWATQAQIMAAYAAYRGQEYDEAAMIVDRFVKLHPTHERVPYAYYLKALSFYDQISDVGRDQKMTLEARQALRDVVNRFPTTEYAQDAQLKLDLTEDHLAGKEMEVGRYYLKQEEYLAAINRFRTVVDRFQTTAHAPEALHRLVEAYLRLGVVEEARKYAAVLGHNYPGSDWYQMSYRLIEGGPEPVADDEGWLGGVL